MKLRILRSFATMAEVTEVFGEPARMIKQEVSLTLQYKTSDSIHLDWQDVPIVDYDEDTGEYIKKLQENER